MIGAWRRAAARLPTSLLAASVFAALLTPIGLWGVLVRSTVVEDIARRETQERQLSARLAGASVSGALEEAARRAELAASGGSFRAALTARDEAALEERLGEVASGTPYETALALDPDGRLLARHPSAPQTYGQSFADRDYYRGALDSEGAHISEAVVSRISGDTFVVVARAVRDEQRVLGILLLTISPARLLEQIAPLNATEGRGLHLVDQRGRVIASTDERLAPLSPMALPAGVDVYSGTGTATMAGPEGQKVVTYGAVGAARWSLLVSDEPSVLRAAQDTLERQLLLGGLGISLLALAVAAGIAWLYTTSRRQRAALAERERELERTNDELATATRHKSEFLAGMSHELRTPLNAILGFSELLEEQLATVTSERHKRYLRNIRDAGTHLLSLINDVLDLSKVEAGKIELRPEHISTAALIDPVRESIASAAAARQLEFDVQLEEADLSIDPGRARQILYNLLSNAVKFTPHGGAINLRVEVVGRTLKIVVRDTGIGIPAGRVHRLFGTFERLHEGRSDAPGTGLGLALTKRLVELHGGTIDVSSQEGRGTSFFVHLADVVVDATVRRRLLVVEDERADADLIVALAAKAGLASEVVRSVAEARAATLRALPLGVVLDMRLADGRGETVLEALKADPVTRAVPVVVVSVEDDDRRSRVIGADDHLTKPIDHARLGAWLRRVAVRGKQEEVDVEDLAS